MLLPLYIVPVNFIEKIGFNQSINVLRYCFIVYLFTVCR